MNATSATINIKIFLNVNAVLLDPVQDVLIIYFLDDVTYCPMCRY